MKKIMTFALCVASVATMSAQKENVDAAKKLSGKIDKIEEARSLIQAAIADPSTASDANTYYIGGKIEFDAFDKRKQSGQVNPNDPTADRIKMAEELINGYKLFIQVLPLDSVPNEKGQVKPRFSGDIVKKISSHADDFFNGGGAMWDAKRFYPEAYESFMIFADMPDQTFLGKNTPNILPADRAQAYLYAGIAAYSGNEVYKAAEASRKARLNGSEDPNAYMYELASWQAIAQRDSTMEKEAYAHIQEVSNAGYQKFGITQPIFISNLVNNYVMDDNYDKAIELVNNLLGSNPDNSKLYGMLGYIYDRQKNDELSLANYMKAVSMQDCDFETLKNASKKLTRVGTNMYGQLDMKDSEGKAKVRTEYFDPALQIAERAKQVKSDDSEVDRIIDNIKYALETYYNVHF